ncbi:hypothetical protein SLEP1_g3339 [Rubroshorea leprosula]|uniref:WRKY domain-containing protein n=1 Tax=Rubroshorea leprosula TaxID=152421 RepID=A0AAV5HK20_9ROSI|nr:hypothetical protein SLEP1_g3339 [Rubroshorea leprosula]
MEKMGDLEPKNLLNELIQGRELAKQLQFHLNAPTSSKESRELLLQRILVSYEKALSILMNCGTSAAAEVQPTGPIRMVESPPSPRSEDSDRDVKDSEAKDTPKKRKTLPRWTQLVPVTSGTGLESPLDDGFSWRKYGQKDILGARYPRGYYRCSHRNVQGCLATKQVQRSDEDPTIFEITYRGRHTCTQAPSSSQIPPTSSPRKQDQDTHLVNPQQLNQQQSQNDLLLNFQKELRVVTENLDIPQSHPYSSFPFPSTSNIEAENALISSSVMGHFSPSFTSPGASGTGTNYFQIGDEGMTGVQGSLNFQSSNSEITDLISATTSTTNSPTVGLGFPYGNVEFGDPNFSFNNSGFFP